jgi:hypothetical protein
MSEEVKQPETQPEEVEETKEPKQAEVDETKTPEKAEKSSEEKTFTQAEIDDIIAKRLDRERKKFEDYDDIKKKASKYEKEAEERRLAELSEKERAEELAKKAEDEKADYAKQLDELRESVKREKIHNEFIKQANAQNIGYVEDALKLADLSAVDVDEDGKVAGVDDVVKSLVESKPFLLAQQQKPKKVGDPSNHTSDKSDKTADQLIQEAADKAKKTGKIEDRMAYDRLKRELGN